MKIQKILSKQIKLTKSIYVLRIEYYFNDINLQKEGDYEEFKQTVALLNYHLSIGKLEL